MLYQKGTRNNTYNTKNNTIDNTGKKEKLNLNDLTASQLLEVGINKTAFKEAAMFGDKKDMARAMGF